VRLKLGRTLFWVVQGRSLRFPTVAPSADAGARQAPAAPQATRRNNDRWARAWGGEAAGGSPIRSRGGVSEVRSDPPAAPRWPPCAPQIDTHGTPAWLPHSAPCSVSNSQHQRRAQGSTLGHCQRTTSCERSPRISAGMSGLSPIAGTNKRTNSDSNRVQIESPEPALNQP